MIIGLSFLVETSVEKATGCVVLTCKLSIFLTVSCLLSGWADDEATWAENDMYQRINKIQLITQLIILKDRYHQINFQYILHTSRYMRISSLFLSMVHWLLRYISIFTQICTKI